MSVRVTTAGSIIEGMAVRSVCVLGGSGFVGTHLCAALVRDGWGSRYRRGSRARQAPVLPTLALVAADIHDPRGSHGARRAAGGRQSRRHPERARARRPRLRAGACGARAQAGRGRRRHACRACCTSARSMPTPIAARAITCGVKAGPSASCAGMRRRRRLDDLPAIGDLRPARRLREPVFAAAACDSAGVPARAPRRAVPPVWVGVVAADPAALADDGSPARCYELGGPEVLTLREIVAWRATASASRARSSGMPDFAARIQAALFDFVPGKPFSTDNYRSLLRTACASRRFRAARNPAAAARRGPAIPALSQPGKIGVRGPRAGQARCDADSASRSRPSFSTLRPHRKSAGRCRAARVRRGAPGRNGR